MTRARSPGYPTIGLREAIEKAKLVYEKDYQNRIPRSLIAQHMGYRSLNGKSMGVLSALTKYGLLEGRGDENHISDLALEIIAHAPNTPERARAIAEAASRPELFAELDTRFQDGRVSDAAIRSFLLTRKFIPEAADTVVRSYRETKEFLMHERGGDHGESAPSPVETITPVPSRHNSAETAEVGSSAETRSSHGEREFLRGPLSRNASYRLLVKGDIGAIEIDKMIQILTLQREFLLEDNCEKLGTLSE
jgi:hypothetical protein